MLKNIIFKIFLLPRLSKIIAILFLDLIIILLSSYLSLAIRLDKPNLFEIQDKYLISIENLLIPTVVYFIFAGFFKFYSLSFRYYNLGQDIYYAFPIFGLSIIFLNVLFNQYFSFGALIINVILILIFIIISRKLISEIYLFFQIKSKINSVIICSSKNLHKIYEYLKLNEKIFIKSIILEDSQKIDFSKYRNLKINNLDDLPEICKKYNIKSIYIDKFSENLRKKTNKNISIKVLQTDNLFKKLDVDIKQQFVENYFNVSRKIKTRPLKYYSAKTILITGAGGSIGKNLFFELLNSNPKKIILAEQDELKLFNLKKEYEDRKSKILKQIVIEFKLGSLSNKIFLKDIFSRKNSIDIILHAAAYKHVGFGEENISSFVKNNIFVTYNLAKISIEKKNKEIYIY